MPMLPLLQPPQVSASPEARLLRHPCQLAAAAEAATGCWPCRQRRQRKCWRPALFAAACPPS